METLFVGGIYIIEYLQHRLSDHGDFMCLVSQIFDPKYGYNIYFPIVFSLGQICGIKMIYAAAVSEYLNLILKWIFQEDRPYWWVQENPDKVFNTSIVQYSITCETGPGSPSGHVMISTAIWYIVVATVVKNMSYVLSVLLWLVFFAILFLIATSRIFVAAHFPHQCILGFLIGIGLGRSFMSMKRSQLQLSQLLISSMMISSSTFMLYNFLNYMELDPNRSISMAIKWCSDPKNVHIDTTPLFCCMRYTGALAGVALGTYNINALKKKLDVKPKYAFLFVALLGLCFSKLFSLIPYPLETVHLYVTSLILHITLTLFIMRVGPELVVRFIPDSKTKVKKGVHTMKKDK